MVEGFETKLYLPEIYAKIANDSRKSKTSERERENGKSKTTKKKGGING